jgi:hypothetical protein
VARDLMDRLDPALLGDDERWLAAHAMTVKGTRWLRDWCTTIDPAVVLQDHARHHGAGSDLQVADLGLPTGLVVAVTGQRVVVFGRSLTGRPRSIVAEWPIDQVSLDVVDSGDRVRSRLFVLGLDDGSLVAGAAGVNGAALERADTFVQAFRAVTARPDRRGPLGIGHGLPSGGHGANSRASAATRSSPGCTAPDRSWTPWRGAGRARHRVGRLQLDRSRTPVHRRGNR